MTAGIGVQGSVDDGGRGASGNARCAQTHESRRRLGNRLFLRRKAGNEDVVAAINRLDGVRAAGQYLRRDGGIAGRRRTKERSAVVKAHRSCWRSQVAGASHRNRGRVRHRVANAGRRVGSRHRDRRLGRCEREVGVAGVCVVRRECIDEELVASVLGVVIRGWIVVPRRGIEQRRIRAVVGADLDGVSTRNRQRQIEVGRIGGLELIVIERDDFAVGTVDRQNRIDRVSDRSNRAGHELEAHHLADLPREHVVIGNALRQRIARLIGSHPHRNVGIGGQRGGEHGLPVGIEHGLCTADISDHIHRGDGEALTRVEPASRRIRHVQGVQTDRLRGDLRRCIVDDELHRIDHVGGSRHRRLEHAAPETVGRGRIRSNSGTLGDEREANRITSAKLSQPVGRILQARTHRRRRGHHIGPRVESTHDAGVRRIVLINARRIRDAETDGAKSIRVFQTERVADLVRRDRERHVDERRIRESHLALAVSEEAVDVHLNGGITVEVSEIDFVGQPAGGQATALDRSAVEVDRSVIATGQHARRQIGWRENELDGATEGRIDLLQPAEHAVLIGCRVNVEDLPVIKSRRRGAEIEDYPLHSAGRRRNARQCVGIRVGLSVALNDTGRTGANDGVGPRSANNVCDRTCRGERQRQIWRHRLSACRVQIDADRATFESGEIEG